MTLPSERSHEPEAPRGLHRDAVLRHVTALIGEHGIDGMTMRQVAQATGLSTGTINYHFGNKRGLVLAALAVAGGAPEGHVPAGSGSTVDALRRVLAGFVLESAERRAWWQFWLEVAAQGVRDAELRDHEAARHSAQRRHVEELIAEGVRRGELRADLDAANVAGPLLALACGLAIQQLGTPDAATVRRASDALEGSVRELAAR